MKKTIILILIILVLTLTSCSKLEEPDNTVKTTTSFKTVSTSKATFNIRYELGNAAEHFIAAPSEAKAGDTVELKTEILIDADIHVYVDDKEITKSHYDSDYWGYSFVMPDKDVKVTAKFYTKDEIWGTMHDESAELREKYPEYFDLSTFKGLEVYVWQMGPNSYSFGLLPGTNRLKTELELWDLKGTSAEEMRAILSSYDIDQEDVFIHPLQHPISSFIPEYWMIFEGEKESEAEARRQAYIDNIRNMLFGNGQETPL